MANNQYINKVVYGNQVLLDLTSDTIEADKLLVGYTAHKANGEPIVGTYEGGGEGYTINLTASSSELYGQDIVVSYEGQRVTTIQFSNAGTASIVVQEEGAYNFAVSYGGLTYYCDVNVVSAIVTYNETVYYYPNGSTVTPVNDIQIWISCANVRGKNYTTLAEVFADSELLATLMASENAVNYLVRSKQFIKSEALVPTMTSNTTPSGECFGSSYYPDTYNRYEYYRTFDGTVSSSEGWNSSETSPTEYIGYDFTENVIVKKVDVAVRSTSYPQRNVTLRGSHDKVTWDDISVLAENITDASIHTYNVTNITAYRYYSIQSTAGSGNSVTFSYIQFYTEEGVTENQTAMSYIGANDYCTNTLLADFDWREAICNSEYFKSVLNVKVPPMTDNTHPSGTAYASAIRGSGYEAYKAFDKDNNTQWQCYPADPPQYIYYKFPSAKKIYLATMFMWGSRIVTFKIQSSSDGNTWVDRTNSITINPTSTTTYSYELNNVADYDYHRVYFSSFKDPNNEKLCDIRELQFYGRENGGVQTWLHLAGITDKLYTTLSEVFADSATLSTLMANHDAVDYLVTCKGWATEVCSNQSAMSYIGLNNYCANTLLADATWKTAIGNSTYFKSVLNVKVPPMTGDDSRILYSTYSSNSLPYYAFDGLGGDSNWASNVTYYGYQDAHPWLGFDFTRNVKIVRVDVTKNSSDSNFYADYKVQHSNDANGTWNDIYSGNSGGASFSVIMPTYTQDTCWRVYSETEKTSNQYVRVVEMQFYGREDV